MGALDRSGGDEASARGEPGQASLENDAPDGVEDDGGLELGDALIVVGQRLSAEFAQAVVFPFACRGEDRRSEVATDVDRRLPRSARTGLDEERVPPLQTTVG